MIVGIRLNLLHYAQACYLNGIHHNDEGDRIGLKLTIMLICTRVTFVRL